MTLSIWNHRGPVTGPWTKKQGETLTLGFIGGSITDGRPRHNWPEPVTAWIVEQLPGVHIAVENAGIGATGSDLGSLRAERDLIDRGTELVFVEFAVNDYDEPVEKRGRTLEGLLRKLLADPKREVVLVYTYIQSMYEYMMKDEKPPIIAQYEAIAEHYGLSSVWMGLHALDEVKRGHMRWEEWLPDGLHPTNRGSYSYGTSVIRFLAAERERSLTEAEAASWLERRQTAMGQPLDPRNWQSASLVELTDVQTTGPWVLRRLNGIPWIDRTLETAAVGAKLSFSFHGRGVALGFDFGKTSAEFRYRLDGGEWQTEVRERPDWVGTDGWFRLSILALDLEIGDHTCEIEVIHGNGPNCNGTNFRLGLIGQLP